MTGVGPGKGIGIIACSSMRAEIEHLVHGSLDVDHLEFLPFGLHADPAHLRSVIIEKVNSLDGRVGAVLIAYGRCQSLERITEQVCVPAVTLDAPDCIGVLLTPRGYDEERTRCAGTWFASPGWRDATAGFILDGIDWTPFVKDLGYDPEQFVRAMFAGYRRCLFIDTGVGDRDGCRRACLRFSEMLDLEYEERLGSLSLLTQVLLNTRRLAQGHSSGSDGE
jgi:hypothetical protein